MQTGMQKHKHKHPKNYAEIIFSSVVILIVFIIVPTDTQIT